MQCARYEGEKKSGTVMVGGHVTLKLSSFYIHLNSKEVRYDFSVIEVSYY